VSLTRVTRHSSGWLNEVCVIIRSPAFLLSTTRGYLYANVLALTSSVLVRSFVYLLVCCSLVGPSVYLSVSLFVCLFVRSFVYLFTFLSFYLSICSFVCSSVHLPSLQLCSLFSLSFPHSHFIPLSSFVLALHFTRYYCRVFAYVSVGVAYFSIALHTAVSSSMLVFHLFIFVLSPLLSILRFGS
jgi:hypothetical protein